LRCSRACFTSFSTSQETGATWLYHGQRVFSEWQLTQAWINTSVTDGGMFAPWSNGAPARSEAWCGRGCTNTDARSHTNDKLQTARPACARRFGRVRPGSLGSVSVWFTPCKTRKAADVFPPFSARARLAPTQEVRRDLDRILPSTSSPPRSSEGSGSLAHPLAEWRSRQSYDLAR